MAWYRFWPRGALIKAQIKVSKELTFYNNVLAKIREQIIELAEKHQEETQLYKTIMGEQEEGITRQKRLQMEFNKINNELTRRDKKQRRMAA